MSVAAAQDWDSVFLLDRYCVVELEFWKNNLRSVNTRSVSDSVTPFVSIYSDASDVACAGHIDGKDICAHRMFTEAERQESSTYRELLAVQFVLSSFSSFLPNSRVK
jgi:nicotinamide mononucleotide adenylyltransferase